MLRVRFEIPFKLNETNKIYPAGAELKISEETFDRIKAVNVNAVSVLEKCADDTPPADVPPEKTKKGKSKKSE